MCFRDQVEVAAAGRARLELGQGNEGLDHKRIGGYISPRFAKLRLVLPAFAKPTKKT